MLSRNKIGVFHEMVENLLLSGRYDELVLFVEPQLLKLISLSESSSWLAKLSEFISLRVRKNNVTYANIAHSWFEWRSRLNRKLQELKSWSQERYRVDKEACAILLNIVDTPAMVAYIAVARPYLGLTLLNADVVCRSEFIELFVDALLDSPELDSMLS